MRSLRLAVAFLLLGATSIAAPLPEGRDDSGSVGLEGRLVAGLQVRRPADRDYIGRVVGMVEEGRLPPKLVDATFLWAVRRRQRHPLPAFREALRLQADRLGIAVE
ncbi:MAG: hypothetical protein KGQ61_11715 [Planctomycetes bacterium]|nr:hypothetical protein [Planctomycetota bacterium]